MKSVSELPEEMAFVPRRPCHSCQRLSLFFLKINFILGIVRTNLCFYELELLPFVLSVWLFVCRFLAPFYFSLQFWVLCDDIRDSSWELGILRLE